MGTFENTLGVCEAAVSKPRGSDGMNPLINSSSLFSSVLSFFVDADTRPPISKSTAVKLGTDDAF